MSCEPCFFVLRFTDTFTVLALSFYYMAFLECTIFQILKIIVEAINSEEGIIEYLNGNKMYNKIAINIVGK